MFNVGPWEWAIILLIILVLFGCNRVTDLARSLGKSISAFKQGMREGQEDLDKSLRKNSDDDQNSKPSA